MTSNQINYQKFLEDQRHNRETEKLTDRQVSAQEYQASAALSNAATNQLNAATNQDQLSINSAAVAAQNYATMVQAQRAREEARHNLISERQNQLKIESEMLGSLNILGSNIKLGGALGLLTNSGGSSIGKAVGTVANAVSNFMGGISITTKSGDTTLSSKLGSKKTAGKFVKKGKVS